MSDSENEFDDWGKEGAPKRKAAISDDDDSFVPEPMADSEVDSPAPPPKAPEPMWVLNNLMHGASYTSLQSSYKSSFFSTQEENSKEQIYSETS